MQTFTDPQASAIAALGATHRAETEQFMANCLAKADRAANPERYEAIERQEAEIAAIAADLEADYLARAFEASGIVAQAMREAYAKVSDDPETAEAFATARRREIEESLKRSAKRTARRLAVEAWDRARASSQGEAA